MKLLRQVIVLCAAIFLWNNLASFCRSQTAGFSILKIQSDLAHYPKWTTDPASKELKKELSTIFSKPFHYLARGGQSFAFVSEDGQYVLKFVKNRSFALYNTLSSLPLPKLLHQLIVKRRDKVMGKIDRDCSSYKIAYEQLADQTGLLYVHFQPEANFDYQVTLTDKLHIKHTLSLNSTTFLLQKKAEPIPSYLNSLKQNPEMAQKAFCQLLDTLQESLAKGIIDEDPGLHRNFGFLEGKPLFIDVGRFAKCSPDNLPSLKRLTRRFRSFLETHHPELTAIFDEEIEKHTQA